MKFKYLLLMVLLVLLGCSDNRPNVNWKFIVPNNYTGFLVIDYNCPNGPDIYNQIPNITVRFDERGVFCTRSKAFAWRGQYFVFNQKGDTIQADERSSAKGYGFLSEGRLKKHDLPVREFSIFWVGDLEEFRRFRNDIAYEKELNKFFQDNLGIQMFP